MSAQASSDPADQQALNEAFARQRAAFAKEPFPDLATRKDRLARLKALLKNAREEIASTIAQDFGHRSQVETMLADIVTSVEAVDYCSAHLARWMKPRRRSTSFTFRPGSSRLLPQPLGVVGIMAPWNYPVNLAAVPLAFALAAGNRALVRMSESTPRTTALFADLIAARFAPEEVHVFGGKADLAAAFAALPFDHLVFTGSTATGRKVMEAAAANLTPVTLELGGKSPAIIAPDYDPDEAAERVTWGKCFNAGQTCIAPDVVYVPHHGLQRFTQTATRFFVERHEAGASDSYTAMINSGARQRMEQLVADAKAHGAAIVQAGGDLEALGRAGKYPLTLVIDPAPSARIVQEEIFGPLMLVRSYHRLEDAIATINADDRPLALYLFTHRADTREQIMRQTHSGGVTINDVMLHFTQSDLPFGGVGQSGMGRYHGPEGFDTFSHLKPVFQQRGLGRWTASKLAYPPYGRTMQRLLRFLGG